MRESLRVWIADADTRDSLDMFGMQAELPQLSYQDGRSFDLYLSLVGELFDLLRDEPDDPRDWATLGNAFAQTARQSEGNALSDAAFYASTAFYSGGYSASAYVTMRQVVRGSLRTDTHRACYDFLARPSQAASQRVRDLLDALSSGAISGSFDDRRREALGLESDARERDPDLWAAERIYGALLDKFGRTNLRAVLPDGSSEKWHPLIGSLLNRPRPVWDFFPSQIDAIDAGLLTSEESFSMQMPTGAGKTALTETLLFSHLVDHPDDLAVLLVPYRALARELRHSIARRLTRVGLSTRTVYGGTVPTLEEAQNLGDLRAIIATPEALTGLLGRAPELAPRISLIVCDEGHLLDTAGRGIGLELLLARFLGREQNRPRTVFVSAIVPNIEEINSWLGGSAQSVVRSTFKPADVEYAVLRPTGRGRATRVGLRMQSVDTVLPAHTIPGFLQDSDFRFTNPDSGRQKTYPFTTVKAQAIAAARKSLALGTVAVFAATKTGDQGVIGLAEELLRQLENPLPLPRPLDEVPSTDRIGEVSEYLSIEYGDNWVGTQALLAGAVVHHGDLPQETREAVEELLGQGAARMVLCTGTLAEGVNLPIRTLVLYAVQRRDRTGTTFPMLARDIKNLVGRAGRAGSSTKGLVICANPSQWDAIAPVASDQPGENVHGALRLLLGRLQGAVLRGTQLSDNLLEGAVDLFPLTDGVDSTLLELLHDDIGDDEFRDLAATLAVHTFAAQQVDHSTRDLLSEVFTMRADRLTGLRRNGRLGWIRETGARARLVDSVIGDLATLLDNWDGIESPLDDELLDAFVTWAYRQPDFQRDLQEVFQEKELLPPQRLPDPAAVREIVQRWIAGETLADISGATGRTVDRVLRIHGSIISYSLATLVEQAVALLHQYFVDAGFAISDAVASLPEYLRFGVPTPAARSLMASGVRHRRAAVVLGGHPDMTSEENLLSDPREVAFRILSRNTLDYRLRFGDFVYNRTVADLTGGDGGS